MAIVEAEHNDQFQIGDEVIYLPERVSTTVTGYDWLWSIDAPPKIVAYQLACGISAAKDLLQPSVSDRLFGAGNVVWTNRDEFYGSPPQRHKAR
jgi:hypothetical protein